MNQGKVSLRNIIVGKDRKDWMMRSAICWACGRPGWNTVARFELDFSGEFSVTTARETSPRIHVHQDPGSWPISSCQDSERSVEIGC